MEQYIKKPAVVAKLESKIKEWRLGSSSEAKYRCEVYKELSEWLDTLEVKEVDLEKEFDKCCENYIFDDECEVYTAKHFFKLGFKAQKGE